MNGASWTITSMFMADNETVHPTRALASWRTQTMANSRDKVREATASIPDVELNDYYNAASAPMAQAICADAAGAGMVLFPTAFLHCQGVSASAEATYNVLRRHALGPHWGLWRLPSTGSCQRTSLFERSTHGPSAHAKNRCNGSASRLGTGPARQDAVRRRVERARVAASAQSLSTMAWGRWGQRGFGHAFFSCKYLSNTCRMQPGEGWVEAGGSRRWGRCERWERCGGGVGLGTHWRPNTLAGGGGGVALGAVGAWGARGLRRGFGGHVLEASLQAPINIINSDSSEAGQGGSQMGWVKAGGCGLGTIGAGFGHALEASSKTPRECSQVWDG